MPRRFAPRNDVLPRRAHALLAMTAVNTSPFSRHCEERKARRGNPENKKGGPEPAFLVSETTRLVEIKRHETHIACRIGHQEQRRLAALILQHLGACGNIGWLRHGFLIDLNNRIARLDALFGSR